LFATIPKDGFHSEKSRVAGCHQAASNAPLLHPWTARQLMMEELPITLVKE
jgi:hypothetical protein